MPTAAARREQKQERCYQLLRMQAARAEAAHAAVIFKRHAGAPAMQSALSVQREAAHRLAQLEAHAAVPSPTSQVDAPDVERARLALAQQLERAEELLLVAEMRLDDVMEDEDGDVRSAEAEVAAAERDVAALHALAACV